MFELIKCVHFVLCVWERKRMRKRWCLISIWTPIRLNPDFVWFEQMKNGLFNFKITLSHFDVWKCFVVWTWVWQIKERVLISKIFVVILITKLPWILIDKLIGYARWGKCVSHDVTSIKKGLNLTFKTKKNWLTLLF